MKISFRCITISGLNASKKISGLSVEFDFPIDS